MSLEDRLENSFFDLVVEFGLPGGSHLAASMTARAIEEFEKELQFFRAHAYDGEAVQVRALELLGARPAGR